MRIRATPVGGREVFVGIGPRDRVARYLDGVARAEIDDIDANPFSVSYRYRSGSAPAGPPAGQTFWAASVEGAGTRDLEWNLESGRWTVVVMNADWSAGVGVEASVGAKAGWVLLVGLGLLIGGVLVATLGAALLAVGALGIARRTGAEAGPEPAPISPASPVRVEARLDEPLSRWLWLVKWLLALPHLVALVVLSAALAVLSVVAGVAILFTGRYPRPIFDFNVGVLRWTWRVSYYTHGAFGTERYPPVHARRGPRLSGHPGDRPAGAVVEGSGPRQVVAARHPSLRGGRDPRGRGRRVDRHWYPRRRRNRPDLGAGARRRGGAAVHGPRYPRGIHDLAVGLNRWVLRVVAYVALLRDQYPPFRLDQGGAEPAPPVAPASSSGPGPGPGPWPGPGAPSPS